MDVVAKNRAFGNNVFLQETFSFSVGKGVPSVPLGGAYAIFSVHVPIANVHSFAFLCKIASNFFHVNLMCFIPCCIFDHLINYFNYIAFELLAIRYWLRGHIRYHPYTQSLEICCIPFSGL